MTMRPCAGELAATPLAKLDAAFGSEKGPWLSRLAHGIDDADIVQVGWGGAGARPDETLGGWGLPRQCPTHEAMLCKGRRCVLDKCDQEHVLMLESHGGMSMGKEEGL